MTKSFKVTSVRDLGPQFTDNPNHMIGQDGAYSIPTSKGLLFYFGDTVIGPQRNVPSLWYPDGTAIGTRDMSRFGDITGMITNSGLFSNNANAQNGIDKFVYITDESGNLRQLVPDKIDQTPEKWRNWCMHGIQIGSKLYLYYIQVEMLTEGELPVNFRVHGSGLAVGNINDLQFAIIDGPHDGLFWKEGEPMFASAVINGSDGFIYTYGVRRDNIGVQRCYIARVKTEDIEDVHEYRYWTGSNWSHKVKDATQIMRGMPNEMSVSWNDWLGCWLAVYSHGIEGRIVAQTADKLEGPWSKPQNLHKVMMPHHGLPYPTLIYAAKEHPELSCDNGRILAVTFIEFEEYYPHLLEIELDEVRKHRPRK